MTVDQVLSFVKHWGRMIASVALLGYILIIVANMFGITLFPAKVFGAQETGVLVAGMAYALSKL